MHFYREHSPKTRNEVIKRLISESKEYDWSSKMKEINVFYDKIFKSPTKDQQQATENLKQRYLYPLKGVGIGTIIKNRIKKVSQKVSWVASRVWQYLGEFMRIFRLKLEKLFSDSFTDLEKKNISSPKGLLLRF